MCYIGLDAGTSGIKALAFDEEGRILAAACQDYPLITPRDGWAELAPAHIWNGAKSVLSQVASRLSDLNQTVRALAVSSAAQTVAPFDCQGRPLYNFITTVDTRTGAQNLWWQEHADEKELFQRTGLPFSPIYMVNKLMWLKEHEPEIFHRAWKFFCVEDYLTWCLSGETVIDYSVASRGMLLNIQTLDWDQKVLELTGIDPGKLSAPLKAATDLGRIRQDLGEMLGLPAETRIILGSHDQTCGTIGCGAIDPGQTMNAIGTVEVLMAIHKGIPQADGVLRCHFPCIPHVLEGWYSVMSLNQNAGVLLKWYKNLFCGGEEAHALAHGLDPYRYLIESSSDRIADVFVLPHINGCETPVSDPASAAAILHMRAHHTKADITRAVLDSMAYDLRQNIEALENIGIPTGPLHAIGGGARTDKLLQLKADCTGRIIHTNQVTEAASLGAAILAAVGTGACPDIRTAVDRMVHTDKTFYPDAGRASEYDWGYGVFRTLYGRLRELNHEVAERAAHLW